MNECCQDKANLKDEYVWEIDEKGEVVGDTNTVAICQVCGRKHYRIHIEPIRIGAEIKPLKGMEE